MKTIVVFDDWETWQMADGAKVITVTEAQFKKLQEGEYPKHLKALKENQILSLKDLIDHYKKSRPEG